MTVDPPQSAEIDLFEAGAAAAAASAAMSTILLEEGALALEERLGAMADVRCEGKVLRGKEESAGETETLGNERDG